MRSKKPSRQKVAKARIAELFKAMETACQTPPMDIAKAIRELPPIETLPLPWTTWLLICLFAHRARQLWGQRMLRERLPEIVPPSPCMCEQDQPVKLYLPNAPEWALEIECICGFTVFISRTTEEFFMADHRPGIRGGPICIPVYTPPMGSTGKLEPGGRLRELHPNFDTVWYAIEELELADIIKGEDDYGKPMSEDLKPDAHRLTKPAVKQVGLVRDFRKKWTEPSRRLWMAAVIGDWLLAHSLAMELGDKELIENTGIREKQCRDVRLAVVRDRSSRGYDWPFDLYALDELGASEVPRLVHERLLARGEDGKYIADATWRFIEASADARWLPEAFSYLKRLSTRRDCRSRLLVLRVAEYLCRFGHRVGDVLRLVSRHTA